MASISAKQALLLPLFEKLTAVTKDALPTEQRDERLKGVGILPRGTLFSCFHEKHLLEATKLFRILYSAGSFEDFLNVARQAREVVNEGLFAYALSVAIAHRRDCRGVTLPPIQEVFPDRFIPVETVTLATKEAKNHPNKDIVVDVQETGNILDPEYKLCYFREDVGMNAHHWYWHVIYPAYWDAELTGLAKDRKGELFCYMHQQMCARYDCERLSNGLHRTKPFHNFQEELEGYASHLTSLVSGLQYSARPEGMSLCDLPDVEIQQMERWRNRILDAIHLHHVHDRENRDVSLDAANGADILGAIIEASSASVNKRYYGSLHNWGHVMLARITDPDGKFQENPGVMSDTSTSLRDPIFYRWHRFVDNIIQDYKETLPAYSKDELNFPGVSITSVQVNAKSTNRIRTFLKQDELSLCHGINFGTEHSVKVRYNHLDYEPFSYTININNTSGEKKHATVRIFLGPKHDELGNVLEPDEQQRFFIELDKFHKELPPGASSVNRNSVESNVTLSHTYTFNDLKEGKLSPEEATEYCNCGWPRHLLIPRGNHRGMEFELFVILTDYTVDNPDGAAAGVVCADAISYCGAKDQKYPDTKPMGFPFDRPLRVHKAEEFLTPNMSCTDIIIQFVGHE